MTAESTIAQPEVGAPPWLRWPRWTVRLRLTLLYGALFVVSATGVLAITYWLVGRFLSTLSAPLPGLTLPAPPGSATGGPDYFVISSTPPPGGIGGQGTTTIDVTPQQVAAQTSAQHAAELHQLLVRSSLALAVVAVVAVFVAWLAAGRFLRPLRAMAGAAQQISEQNLERRLALAGPHDELKDLGDTFDGLLSRLEGAFDAQRNFVANASHELRTPLTLVRALVQMRLRDPNADVNSYRSTCEEVLAATGQQEALIESLLTLARSQRGLDQQEGLDLGQLASEVVAGYQRTANEREIMLRASVAAAPVVGDEVLLARLMSNLVDNALRYNVAGGTVEVVVEPRSDQVVLEVTNTGPIVPAGDVERILQPFQRSSEEQDGERHGLGLSIVAAVAAAHGARLAVQARSGGGLEVHVSFGQQ